MVNVMGLIERACDKCGGDGWFRDPRIWGTMPGSARCDSCDGTGKIEVDPASQLRGAVEALEEIARLEHVNAADAAVNVAGRVAREALDRLGGQ